MHEHLACLVCLLIFQLKNRLQLCSRSSLSTKGGTPEAKAPDI